MQREGEPRFIQAHQGDVKGVAFSPKERYNFCSGGADGKVNVYNVLYGEQVMSTKLATPNVMRQINAVKYNSDGSRILSTTSKRLSVIDAERCELISSYDNCAYAGKDKVALACDPCDPNIAICSSTNGKGLITFDLRKQQPAHFALSVHSSLIRDVTYLDGSWPFGESPVGTVVSLSVDGVCKIRTIDDKLLHTFDVKHRSNSITATPGYYTISDGYTLDSVLLVGGDGLTGYIPSQHGKEPRLLSYAPNEKSIHKVKYSSNGLMLYAISEGGIIKRFRRFRDTHELLDEVFKHDDEILDMDLSPNDEFIITAARNGYVGFKCLGAPSNGCTGFMEFA